MNSIDSTLNAELAAGKLAVQRITRAIAGALALAAVWCTAWYVGILLTLLIAVLYALARIATALMVSDESFAALGHGIGRALGCARNLIPFGKKPSAQA